MRMPPDFMMDLLKSIETVVLDIYQEFPKLADADVEWVCDKLCTYQKTLAKGKPAEEPESTSEMKQALVDEILNLLDARQEAKVDEDLINNPAIRLGENMFPSVAQLNYTALKAIKGSTRFWRKKDGRTGYLRHISEFIV